MTTTCISCMNLKNAFFYASFQLLRIQFAFLCLFVCVWIFIQDHVLRGATVCEVISYHLQIVYVLKFAFMSFADI